MFKSGIISVLLFGLLSLNVTAEVVHISGAGAVQGSVERQGDLLVVTTPATGNRAEAEVTRIPASRVLFIEPARGEALRKVHGEIGGVLYRVGSSSVQKRLEAHHELKQYDAGKLFRPLVRNLTHSRAQVRHFCAFKLGELGSQEALNDLAKVAMKDKDEGVRDAALAASMKIGHPHLFAHFVRPLFDSSTGTRLRAAKAISAIGDIRGVEYLIKRYAISGGGSGARSSVSSMSGKAYIKDFDVEIAQAAQIADPIVGVVNSGAVLDAKVVGIYGTMTTIEKRVISESLEDLTGRNFGPNPSAWMDWWGKEKDAFKKSARKAAGN